IRRSPELMQLEMGISTRRYLPASGTAGLARSLVSGNRRVPCPPPMMTESTLLVLVDWRPLCVNCDIEVPLQQTTKRVIRRSAAPGKLWEIRSEKCEGRQTLTPTLSHPMGEGERPDALNANHVAVESN